jgi:hypothetical protein
MNSAKNQKLKAQIWFSDFQKTTQRVYRISLQPLLHTGRPHYSQVKTNKTKNIECRQCVYFLLSFIMHYLLRSFSILVDELLASSSSSSWDINKFLVL